VGVREDYSVHAAWVVGKVQVSGICLTALTLIQATIQQQVMPVELQQMLTSGDRMRRAVKMNLHA